MVNTLGALVDPNQPGAGDGDGRVPPAVPPRVIADARRAGASAIHVTIGHVFGPRDPFVLSVHELGQWDAILRSYPADLERILFARDIDRAKAEGKIGVIYGFQNASMLGGDPARVDVFHELGVRIIQLTYNDANQLGGGATAATDHGVTPLGRRMIQRLNAKGVVVDLAHSGERTCLDAIEASSDPVAITHTGCRALNDHPRNKSDRELRALADKGGYVGIYFMPFLVRGRDVTGDDVVSHLEHAIRVCGEDHVGIGTDGSFSPIDDMDSYRRTYAQSSAKRKASGIAAPGEGFLPFAVDMTGPCQLVDLTERLDRRGHSASRIEKILGLNFVRFAGEVWDA